MDRYGIGNVKKRLKDLENARRNEKGEYVIGYDCLSESQLESEIEEAKETIEQLKKLESNGGSFF